jgi:starch-binding outer membrane protein, SusD/RagB family
MKMKKIYLIIFLVLTIAFTSCKEWVTDLEPTNDLVTEEQMNTQANVSFMIIGLHNRLAIQDEEFLCSDGLSDALFFNLKVGNSTYSTYQELDLATDVLPDNSNVTTAFSNMQALRMNADTLVGRCLYKISFTSDAAGITAKNNGLYWGYLYGGLARYYLGAYFGKDKTTGGATINLSHFIPTATLYTQAISRFTEALKYTTDTYNIRLLNSLIARVYLMSGNYTSAVTYLNLGLVSGDKALTANYSYATRDNQYRGQAGETRQQWAVDNRFADYVTAVPDEAKRISLVKLVSTDKTLTYYRQAKYIQLSDGTTTPIAIIDWQEVNLMKAECTVRGYSAGDPVTLINAIRTSHGMTATITTTPDLNGIYVERDKELFLRGNRLLDQRRFNRLHVSSMWQDFPIPLAEQNRNPNWNL